GGEVDVNFFQQISDRRVPCATVRVSNSSLEPEEKAVDPQCRGRSFLAELEMAPDPGWHQVPRPEVVDCPSDACGFEVRIIRSRTPSQHQRHANLRNGRRLLPRDEEAALF